MMSRPVWRVWYGLIGNIPIPEITPPMVLSVIKDIDKTRAIETASRVKQRLSAIFCYGIATGVGSSDPADVIKGGACSTEKGASAGYHRPGKVAADDC
ncbi:MAG: hypothetical protein ABF430_12835 [Acetobacter persici]|uniref:phage integrase central domain-containing protein n=1 Tax=Acetobacter persici TaxID=1076596 RepID=UPI0039EC2709